MGDIKPLKIADAPPEFQPFLKSADNYNGSDDAVGVIRTAAEIEEAFTRICQTGQKSPFKMSVACRNFVTYMQKTTDYGFPKLIKKPKVDPSARKMSKVSDAEFDDWTKTLDSLFNVIISNAPMSRKGVAFLVICKIMTGESSNSPDIVRRLAAFYLETCIKKIDLSAQVLSSGVGPLAKYLLETGEHEALVALSEIVKKDNTGITDKAKRLMATEVMKYLEKSNGGAYKNVSGGEAGFILWRQIKDYYPIIKDIVTPDRVISLLRSGNQEVQVAAAFALYSFAESKLPPETKVKLISPAVESFKKNESDKPVFSKTLIHKLSAMAMRHLAGSKIKNDDKRRLIPTLEKAVRDSSPEVCREGIWGLAELVGSGLFQGKELKEMASFHLEMAKRARKNGSLREDTVAALGFYAMQPLPLPMKQKMVEILLTSCDDPDSGVRYMASEALAKYAPSNIEWKLKERITLDMGKRVSSNPAAGKTFEAYASQPLLPQVEQSLVHKLIQNYNGAAEDQKLSWSWTIVTASKYLKGNAARKGSAIFFLQSLNEKEKFLTFNAAEGLAFMMDNIPGGVTVGDAEKRRVFDLLVEELETAKKEKDDEMKQYAIDSLKKLYDAEGQQSPLRKRIRLILTDVPNSP